MRDDRVIVVLHPLFELGEFFLRYFFGHRGTTFHSVEAANWIGGLRLKPGGNRSVSQTYARIRIELTGNDLNVLIFYTQRMFLRFK